MNDVGVVVIGRNEGERLRHCLTGLRDAVEQIVYVDSGSTDGSCDIARSMDVDVVDLDVSVPFTAARARNTGFERLIALWPNCRFVQFVDGDCEVNHRWLATARETLDHRPDVAVVCGRRREREPDASIYNRLCDIEWDTPIGEARACGGDAMMRADAFHAVDGFDGSVIAGEEPELCVRLRRNGGRILRLDAEMTLHDAAITRFGQWWKRAVRSGHAYAQGTAMHGRSLERHYVKETRSILFWAVALPVGIFIGVTAGLSGLAVGWFLAAFLAMGYPTLYWRIYRHRRARGQNVGDAGLYACFCVLGKFPQVLGWARYWMNRRLNRRSRIIEYKQTKPRGRNHIGGKNRPSAL